MCIIQAADPKVSKTCILVAPVGKDRQLIIYENKVGLAEDGVMILPVPRSEINFVDLSESKELFKSLAKAFEPISLGMSRGMSKNSADDSWGDDVIEVKDVGSYQVSVVPTLGNFHRLDAAVFVLDPKVGDFLAQQYDVHDDTGFSFIVCKLKSGIHTYHPLAYTSGRQTGLSGAGTLFIPTMHYHLDSQGRQHADWDHQIYTWGCELLGMPFRGQGAIQRFDQTVMRALKACGLPYKVMGGKQQVEQPTCSVTQYEISRYNKNHDLMAAVTAVKSISAF